MSSVIFLEKLLDGVAVEWKELREFAQIYDGTHQTPKYTNSGVPFVSVQNIKNIYSNDKFISKEDFDKYKYKPRKNDFFMTRIGDVGTCAFVENDKPLAYYVTLALIRVNQDIALPKFIRYLIDSNIGKSELYKRTLINAVPLKINLGDIGKIHLPIPCPSNPRKSLEIQAEIVRILDAMTAHATELTAELTARKKQYNYYRDKLLSFEGGEVEWKKLGEVAVIGTGSHDTQDAIEDGNYIFYARGREPLKLNVFDFDETAIITAGDGAGVGKVFHYAQGKYALHQRAYRIAPREMMNARFLYHYIASYFYTYIQKASVSSSVTSLRRPMFLNFAIPVPVREEQDRIVAILDKFDALTTSITEGLPREIELRQKQYGYYRELLLSFPGTEEV